MVRLFLFWMLCSLPGFCLETVAWKVPIDLVIDGGTGHPEVTRLEKPPIESTFLKKSDELWDISKALVVLISKKIIYNGNIEDVFDPFDTSKKGLEQVSEELRFDGVCAVWNATSGMIVARGDSNHIQFVDRAVDLLAKPMTASVQFDYHRGDKKTAITLHARSGEVGRGGLTGMKAEIAPVIGSDLSLVDIAFNVLIEHDEFESTINTASILSNEERQEVAHWWDGKQNCKLGMKVNVLTSWGVPADQVVTHEDVGGGEANGIRGIIDYDGMQIGEDLVLQSFNVPPDFLPRVSSREHMEFNSLKVPDELSDIQFLLRVCLDVKKTFQSLGVTFESPLALVGFDPKSSRIICINTPTNIDIIEQIVMPLCNCGSISLIESLLTYDNYTYLLISHSSEISSIKTKRGDEEIGSFELAANVNLAQTILDVSYAITPYNSGANVNSATTLLNDKPTKIGGYVVDGKETELIIRSKIIECDGDHSH